MSERFYVALARCDAGIRGMGGSDESAAAAGALRPRKAAPRGLTAVMGACRLKDFVSRGSRGRTRADVLRLPIAFRERQWVLHRFFDGLEEAVVGAYTGRLVRHEVARSVEVNLLRGVHGA